MLFIRFIAINTRSFFFFFNDTATTEIYTLSLHDALPISRTSAPSNSRKCQILWASAASWTFRDRKSTRLNSTHTVISYAVFCLKKKKTRGRDINHAQVAHKIRNYARE